MRALIAALLIMIGSCTYIEPDDPAMHTAASAFVEAVERDDPPAAFALLTREARSRIDYERFAATAGDLKPVVEAFRAATITTRNPRPRDEPAIHVARFGGREGTIVAVMVQEDGEWRVANVLEWTDPQVQAP